MFNPCAGGEPQALFPFNFILIHFDFVPQYHVTTVPKIFVHCTTQISQYQIHPLNQQPPAQCSTSIVRNRAEVDTYVMYACRRLWTVCGCKLALLVKLCSLDWKVVPTFCLSIQANMFRVNCMFAQFVCKWEKIHFVAAKSSSSGFQ